MLLVIDFFRHFFYICQSNFEITNPFARKKKIGGNMKNSTLSTNYKIAMTGAFSALSIVLAFTPLGYIQLFGTIQITLMHIPVILVTTIAGLVPGIITGLVFGLTSLIKNLTLGASASIFFLNPLISVLPRMLFPISVWAIYKGLLKVKFIPKIISGTVSAIIGTFCHTFFVMGAIFLIYHDTIVPLYVNAAKKIGFDMALLSEPGKFLAILASTLITNSLLEMLTAGILTASVFSSIYIAGKRKSKLSELEEK